MQVRSSNTELETLNSLSPEQANAEFLKCCGSGTWARAMNEARPFATIAQLLVTADDVWSSLSRENWLEAFRAHPKIGEKKAAITQSEQAQKWSAQEQAGTRKAAAETKAALAESNRKNLNRFDFIFVICRSVNSADEMLSSLNNSFHNDPQTELVIASAEQRKITRLRLEKLIKK